MKDKCPFRESGRCNIWIDYQVLQYALQEADELISSNWKEIQRLYDRINLLEKTLLDAGLTISPEQ